MILLLPCHFGESFETLPSVHGKTEQFRLVGFNRSMRWRGTYSRPTVYVLPPKYLQASGQISVDFLDHDRYVPHITLEIPDRYFELHSLSEDGIPRKGHAEFCGALLVDGNLKFDFMFPRDRYRHERFDCEELYRLFKPAIKL